MGFLRIALDDITLTEDPSDCGRCSYCTGRLPDALALTATPESVTAAQVFCRGIDIPLEPRKMWPSGMPGRRGRIPGALLPAVGRALAFADDPGWSDLVGHLVADDDRGFVLDVEAPDEVIEALTAVLARWTRDWPDRPVAVVPVPSRTRPLLIASMARRLAEVGRLPVVDLFEMVGPRPLSGLASGARAAAVDSSIRLVPGAIVPTGPLLLIDDICASGWTLTIASALLRDAGSGDILPMVLHKRAG